MPAMVCLFSRRGRDRHGGQIGYGRRADEGTSVLGRAAMTTREDTQDSWGGPAGRQPHDQAYFLNLLGDSHTGLGRHEAAIEAYRQAAEAFKSQGAHCSYALCLWKVAERHLSLGEPWHALGLPRGQPSAAARAGTDPARGARARAADAVPVRAGRRALKGSGERKHCRRIPATRALRSRPGCASVIQVKQFPSLVNLHTASRRAENRRRRDRPYRTPPPFQRVTRRRWIRTGS